MGYTEIMSNSLHICSTGFNKLPGDDANTRTVEVEVGNFDVEPNVRMKAAFKVCLARNLHPNERDAWLELRGEKGNIIGYVLFQPAVKSL